MQGSEFGEPGSVEPLRFLDKGDYFGEVSLLFNCHRTATIIVNDYGMYGKLNDSVMEEIFMLEPSFKKALQKRTEFYNDSLKIFLRTSLLRIDYL